MAVYAFGDVHGCYDAFRRLLTLIGFNPQHDRLWLTGDLVNRGTQSLAMLRWAYEHRHCVTVVLGNHDLHLLAVAAGAAKIHGSDTLSDILQAPDSDTLCRFLRRQPLAHYEDGWLLVHAGVLPMWSVEDTLALAAEVQQVLRGAEWDTFVHQMYGNEPARWRESLSGAARWRVIINALTRLRICTAAGELRLDFTGAPATIPAGYLPWFAAPKRRTAAVPIIFGHWSTLGLIARDNIYALDTGYLWGRQLTALRLSDKEIFQVTGEYSAATMPANTNKPNQ